ncbi:hypothetical protein C8Q74DRAFT_1362530 [Fomes fomentarius]|nr:hypothetical protein C8Q74DRAFT_1362530 [Fomes fomentarius]
MDDWDDVGATLPRATVVIVQPAVGQETQPDGSRYTIYIFPSLATAFCGLAATRRPHLRHYCDRGCWSDAALSWLIELALQSNHLLVIVSALHSWALPRPVWGPT